MIRKPSETVSIPPRPGRNFFPQNPRIAHNGPPARTTSARAFPRAGKRERILSAAVRLFAHRPYQQVTMDQVAHLAAVAKGTLYLYFRSKEALYLGILRDGLESVTQTYESRVAASTDPRERVTAAINVTIRFYDERRDLLRLIATEEPRMAEARNRLLSEWRERGFNFFTSLIQEGIAGGIFAATDSRVATLLILGGIRSVLLHETDHPVAGLAENLGRLVLGGLCRRDGADPAPLS